MVERFVAVVYLIEHPFGFEMSPEFNTYGEAVDYIDKWSANSNFDYGIIEKRFRKGEAQPDSPSEDEA
jgi:hypothetical protein